MKKMFLIVSTLFLLILISSLVMARIVPREMGDSDGGIVYDVKGTCVDSDLVAHTDYCTGNTLTEYYIPQGDDVCAVSIHACNYCQSGECTSPMAIDSDNSIGDVDQIMSVDVAGSCSVMENTYNDAYSFTNHILSERYASGSFCPIKQYECTSATYVGSKAKCTGVVDGDIINLNTYTLVSTEEKFQGSFCYNPNWGASGWYAYDFCYVNAFNESISRFNYIAGSSSNPYCGSAMMVCPVDYECGGLVTQPVLDFAWSNYSIVPTGTKCVHK